MEAPPPAPHQCAICLGGESKPPSQTVLTTCSHRFCKDELVQWLALRGTCPVCRSGLSPQDIRLANGAPLDVPVPIKAPEDSSSPSTELSNDERNCLWLTFILGFFCGLTWMIGVCTFGSRGRHDRRCSVRIPWLGNIIGSVLLCCALIFGFVWVIWPRN